MGEIGKALEDKAQKLFESMGFTCINDLAQARLQDLDPKGSYSEDEHLEFDLLIPIDNLCLIGEITGRKADIQKKYKRFRRHINLIKKISPLQEQQWKTLGVCSDKIDRFCEIDELRFFFICTEVQRFDVDLSPVPGIVVLYKKDWLLLNDYANAIGSYAKNHFLSKFDIPMKTSDTPLQLNKKEHNLFRTPNRRIVSGQSSHTSDVYNFEVDPYKLLNKAQVFRANDLPSLSGEVQDYQRPLDKKKLSQIRSILKEIDNFLFPNSILVILSKDCTFDKKEGKLTIPDKYGAIEVIDGQHRLFSYADKAVEKKVTDKGKKPKIIVTAIMPKEKDQAKIRQFSARTFVEINTNQTKIRANHIDAIKYPILGIADARAIAAQVILRANEEKNTATYGLFDTYQTGLGIIQATTIIGALKPMMNTATFSKLCEAKSSSKEKQGYQNLFCQNGQNLAALMEPDNLIDAGRIALIRYFNLIKKVFPNDWPVRNEPKGSCLELAKVIAAFIKLFNVFVKEGLSWKQVEDELESIKRNFLRLRGGQKKYNDYAFLLDPNLASFPDSQVSVANNLKFLQANRKKATRIQSVIPDSNSGDE